MTPYIMKAYLYLHAFLIFKPKTTIVAEGKF